MANIKADRTTLESAAIAWRAADSAAREANYRAKEAEFALIAALAQAGAYDLLSLNKTRTAYMLRDMDRSRATEPAIAEYR